MCGIAGFVNLNGAPADVAVLRRMTDVQRHRGPDDQGFRLFSLTSARSVEVLDGERPAGGGFEGALGFNRLKILDLSQCGHQPMMNHDGTVMVAFNGEIYNAFDYKPELEASGFRFRSRTDTEVILYLYEKYGLDGTLDRLNGMFAIVIVDLRKHEIHIARDHFGIKPFYWTMAGSSVLFASEAKAFLSHPEFRAAVDADRIDEYLAFRYIAGGQSLLKGVQQLRPGWCLRIAADGVSTRRYWQLPDHARRPMSDREAMEQFDQLVRASVKSQLLSDVKVGCQLSGGIDSSVVSVFARSHFDADMETFSIIFDDPRHTEEAWVDQAARTARAVSHKFTFTADFFLDTIAKASWHMDQPMGHPNSIGIWLLAQRAHEFVTVLLSGEGADEVFGGYTRFYYANLRPRVAPWLPVLRYLPRVGSRLSRQFGGNPVDSFIMASLFQQPSELGELRPGANFTPALERRREMFGEGRADHLSNCFRYEMQTYLVDLLVRQDKMTMAHSVENRVPFLDRHLVDFTRRVPLRLLVADTIAWREPGMRGTKVMLKRLAAQSFDDQFVYRQKSGFSLPLAGFFATSRFTQLMEDGLLPGMRSRGLVSADVVRSRWKSSAAYGQGAAESVWISVALELWAQQFIDAPAVARRPPAESPVIVRTAARSTSGAPAVRSNGAGQRRPLRVVFCWAEVAGYMAACWKALAEREGIELHILHTRQLFARPSPFDLNPLLAGLSNTAFARDSEDIDHRLLKEVAALNPDVAVMCGWIFWPYTRLMSAKPLKHVAMVLGMDSPWLGSVRQRLGRYRLLGIARHTDLAVTAGERSGEYARRMGIPANKIRNGYYGFDYDRFEPAAERRAADGRWPRQFLFVGRYVPQKDLRTLMAAYAEYRRGVSNPWGLTCCGTGDDAALLKNVDGVADAGFVQPEDQPEVFRRHGAFILPSKFEPWGVVLAEAAASGLPLVCTTACGAGVDLVRPNLNGLVTSPGDVAGLAGAMRWIHDHEDALPEMGRQGQVLSEAFSARAWAVRWHRYLHEAVENHGARTR